jgi:CheY-like chemotaxis protein
LILPDIFVFAKRSVNSTAELKIAVKAGLAALVDTFEGHTEKVMEIVAQFVIETPNDFDLLKNYLSDKNWKDAAFLVHKVKARYGYFGLDEILFDLDHWETELLDAPNTLDHMKEIARFQSDNQVITDELKNTPYYYQPAIIHTVKKLPLKGKCVLVAEDDEVNSFVLSLFVQELGGVAVHAKEGLDVLRLTRAHAPDLILMDIHTPWLSGNQIIRELRAMGFTKPIVSLSAHTSLHAGKESMEAGASDFLRKPASRDLIQSTLVKYLGCS